jgi:hypothetical protein
VRGTKRSSLFAFAAVTTFAMSNPLGATTWHIQADGTGDRPTIRSGVLAAADGDTLLLAPGTYTGDGNWNVWIQDKALAIRSESGPDATIIDCQSTGYGIVMYRSASLPGATLEVSGITVQNAADTVDADGYGPYSGIIIWSYTLDSAIADNDVVSNCAGGLSVGRVPEGTGRVLARNNRVMDSGWGLVANCNSPTGASEITGNLVSGCGRGLSVLGIAGTIANNPVRDSSGGLQVSGRGGLDITSNVVTANNVGIAMEVDDVSSQWRTLRIEGNVVADNMGSTVALLLSGGGNPSYGPVSIQYNTVGNNVSEDGHAGVLVYLFVAEGGPDNPGIALSHNIIAFNSGVALLCGYDNMKASCNDIFGNAEGDAICGTDGGGNISFDPLFCDADGGDYSLRSDSPCLVGACGQIGALGEGCEAPVATLFTAFGAKAGAGVVEVRWEVSSDEGVESFVLHRSEVLRAQAVVIAEGVFDETVHSHIDTDVVPGATYSYELVLRTRDGVEIRSPEATATVPTLTTALAQNYPNPFNPSTTIEYTLGSTSLAVIGIYDASGKRVAEIDDGVRPPGTYRVEWNGRDTHGNALASGVYFYRIEGVPGAGTRKMIFVK